MAYDRFLIAPLNSGWHEDLKPFMIPDDAFERLVNVYIFRGRVKKRFGSRLLNGAPADAVAQLYSRLRINIGTTAVGTGNFNLVGVPGAIHKIGQIFSIGDTIFTITTIAAGAQPMLTTGAATGTYNITTNTVNIVGNAENPNTPVYFYPAEPVMGLLTYERPPVNDEPTYAFDTQFAYQYIAGAWERLGAAIWTGNNSQLFWGDTWRGVTENIDILFVSNYRQEDRMKYWNGITTVWTNLCPVLSTGQRLNTARIIVPFKDRLVCLNTIENTEGAIIGNTAAVTGNFAPFVVPAPWDVRRQSFIINNVVFTVTIDLPGPQAMESSGHLLGVVHATGTYDRTTGTVQIVGNNENPNTPVYYLPNTGLAPVTFRNRCRFSQNGNPLSGEAWRQDIPGLGGYTDCPTQEAIISAQFIRDHLIVFFERSTWELVYTNNQVLPFVWQQLNTELGVESTFSEVPFDTHVLGVGNVGIHACNGVNVERVDNKIPDEVFRIHNENEGPHRVYGIRDYYTELVYWTFPDQGMNPIYPTKVLVYNYKNGSWGLNNDSITCFGYFQNVNDITWASSNKTWEESIEEWDSGSLQGKFRHIIAGNQEGFTFIIDSKSSRNSPALQITNIVNIGPDLYQLTIIDHNLDGDIDHDYIIVENVQGMVGFNRNIYQIQIIDVNNIIIQQDVLKYGPVAGVYTGGGTVARVSNIDILTKQYNFYQSQGKNAYIAKVDFNVDKTNSGQITVDYYPSSSQLSLVAEGTVVTNSILGTGILETSPYALQSLEIQQTRIWHPLYFQTDGETIQLRLYMSRDQIEDRDIAWSDFELNAIVFYGMPVSRLQ